jgi:Tol biopolymer transport system component
LIACSYLLVIALTSPFEPFTKVQAAPAAIETTPTPGASRLPRIEPDYLEVTIPPNLAPLNLVIQEPGTEYRLRVGGAHGQAIELQQPQPQVRFPMREWKNLVQTNRGGMLRWTISVRNASGEWLPFAPFESRVSQEDIDPYLVYRRLHPLYSTYKHLGVYQRHLETFDEKPVLRNEAIDHGCVNCHTPFQGDPHRFAISFRGRNGTPTFLVDGKQIVRIDTKMGYLSWHPSGKLLAFADNAITQFFHLAGPINRDVNDAHSDINILHTQSRKVEKPALIATTDYNENWPSWSPDGRYLYYCSAPTVAQNDVSNFRYSLLRIAYDPDQNKWGEPETILSSAEHHLSAHQPRVSPNGHFLVFTRSESGSFPLFRPDSDLYLLRLETRKLEPLPINSKHAETWHGWSSNGSWLFFASRGLDGVFSRVMFSHVDPAGHFSKPLLLPQEDPAYYGTCLDNFNAPELARGPIQVSEEDLARAYRGLPGDGATGNARAPLSSRQDPALGDQ